MRAKLLAVIVAVAASAAVVQAEPYFKSWKPEWKNQEPLDPRQSGWSWNEPKLEWTVWEWYRAGTAQPSEFGCSGETNPAGPEALGIAINKDVTNGSGFDWTGYEIEITGTKAEYISGTMYSDSFAKIVEDPIVGGVKLTFSDGVIPIGDVGAFSFGLDIQYGSLFDFSIKQTPIPEPATFVLVGAAGLLIRRRY